MPCVERLGETLFFLLEHALDVRALRRRAPGYASPISSLERRDQRVEERLALTPSL